MAWLTSRIDFDADPATGPMRRGDDRMGGEAVYANGRG